MSEVNGACACKGIRTCLLCETEKKRKESESNDVPIKKLKFCSKCGNKAWSPEIQHDEHLDKSDGFKIEGIYVVEECITPEEEAFLVSRIDEKEWTDSQSGRRKQDFGPKVNFKKRKCKLGEFKGLPEYIEKVFYKLKRDHSDVLNDFIPVELCNLDYQPSRGAAIDPHKDDSWLWGDRLVTINYLSSTILTLTRPEQPAIEIAIEMPPRSLLVLHGEARHDWLHAIKRQDIKARRMATTLRELTPRFLPGGEDYEKSGCDVLRVAANYV